MQDDWLLSLSNTNAKDKLLCVHSLVQRSPTNDAFQVKGRCLFCSWRPLLFLISVAWCAAKLQAATNAGR